MHAIFLVEKQFIFLVIDTLFLFKNENFWLKLHFSNFFFNLLCFKNYLENFV